MQSDREIQLMIGGAPVDLENVVTASDRKVAVYTAIFADYDEPPALQNIDSGIDYFLFTDGSVTMAPAPWQIRIIDPIFVDPQRDARRVKVLPHLFLPRPYEISVWVDSSLSVKNLTVEIVEQLLANADMAVTRHNRRSCIYDEAKAVLDVKYESAARIERQIARYRIKGFPNRFGLHATMFLARRHLREECLAFNLEWWEEISLFSKRDQISFDYIRWRHRSVSVNTLQMDFRYNPIFGFKLTGQDHKSSTRIVDEHLHTALRHPHGTKSSTPVYTSLYDFFSLDFVPHLRNLRKIEMACSHTVRADPLFCSTEHGSLYSPPDPRKGLEREIFLRALAGRERLLDMQFGNGGTAAFVMCHTPLAVMAIDTDDTRHAEPCTGYLNAYFGQRLTYTKLRSSTLQEAFRTVSCNVYDAIHVDGSADPDMTFTILSCAVAYARPGTAVIITGLESEGVSNAISLLRDRDILVPHGDLLSTNQAAFLVAKNVSVEAEDVLPAMLVA